MRQKRWGEKPIDQQSDREAATAARAINKPIRLLRNWCSLHQNSYLAYVTVHGKLHNSPCEKCAEEGNWVRQATIALKGEGVPVTGPVLLARAEAMAGKYLHRYKHYDENGEFL